MATTLLDLIDKWMKECDLAKEVCELVVTELLEMLPSEVRVGVQKRMQDIMKGVLIVRACKAHEKISSITPTFILATPPFDRVCR